MKEKNRYNEGGADMERRDNLRGYVKENKDRLERLALHGNDVTSAMAVAILEKEKSSGE